MAYSSEFVIGSLFPRTSSGQPNIIKRPAWLNGRLMDKQCWCRFMEDPETMKEHAR